jgi:hypothetical protein
MLIVAMLILGLEPEADGLLVLSVSLSISLTGLFVDPFLLVNFGRFSFILVKWPMKLLKV